MRERSRTARAKTAILLVASIFALALLAPNASAAPFPDRKSSSYGATSFLAYAAGQLQAGGWHTETLPYSTVVKVESAREKTVLLVVAEGHNLLALENGSVKALDCLLVAPYDNVFRDNPEAPEGDSFGGILVYGARHSRQTEHGMRVLLRSSTGVRALPARGRG